jgi:hypothetical protein
MGVPYRDAFPGLAAKPLHDMLDRVYAIGQPETRTDFTVVPRRAADGTVNGLLVIATDVADRVVPQVVVPQIVAEMQEALLPPALPVLPRARIAARYLVAGQEQSAVKCGSSDCQPAWLRSRHAPSAGILGPSRQARSNSS